MVPRLIPTCWLISGGFAMAVAPWPTYPLAQTSAVPISTEQALEELHWLLFDATDTAENAGRADQLWYGLRATGLSPRDIAQALVRRELDELASQGAIAQPGTQESPEVITANVERALAGWAVEEEVVEAAPPVMAYEDEDDEIYEEFDWSFGARAVGFKPFGPSLRLGLSEHENPSMYGGGGFSRVYLAPWLGFEMSLDYATGSSGDVRQRQIPLVFTTQFHPLGDFASEAFISPYLFFGMGVQWTELSYLNGEFKHEFVEGVFTAGVGADIALTRRLRLHTELGIAANLKDEQWRSELSSACGKSSAAQAAGLCAEVWRADSGVDANMVFLFTAGVSVSF